MSNLKFIKKTAKILAWLLLFVLGVLTISALLVRQPGVQQFLAEKAAKHLEKKLGTKVEIGNLRVTFFDEVRLEKVLIHDLHQDTLAYLKHADATISFLTFSPFEIRLRELNADSLQFNLRRYPGEDKLNIAFLSEAFKSEDTTKPEIALQLTRLRLTNSDFSYLNYNKNKPDSLHGIDWNDLDLTAINMDLDGIRLYKDSINAVMRHLQFREKSGFTVQQLSGDAHFAAQGLHMESMRLQTSSTALTGDVAFSYDSLRAFNKFTSAVKINSKFKKSTINFSDISYFAPELKGLDKEVIFTGNIRGTIKNLRGRDVVVRTGRHTTFRGDVDIRGLPLISETYLRLTVDNLITHKTDIDQIPLPPFDQKRFVQTPANFGRLGLIRYQGEFSGFFNEFLAYGTFRTNLGNIKTDMVLKLDSIASRSSYKGNIVLQDFQAGKFFDIPQLGSASLTADVNGRGFETDNINAKIKGTFNYIDLKGYRYKNLTSEGEFAKGLFKGNLAINDPNLVLAFDGSVNFTGKLPEYNFHADVSKARLAKLNIVKRDSSANLAAVLDIRAVGSNFDNMKGTIRITSLTYDEKDSHYVLDKITAVAAEENGEKSFEIKSDMADGYIRGEYNIAYLPRSLRNYFRSVTDTTYFAEQVSTINPEQNFLFDIHVKDLDPVTELFYPQLSVAPNTHFSGNYSNAQSRFRLNGTSPEVLFHGFRFHHYFFNAESGGENSLALSTGSRRVHLSDSMYIENFKASATTLGKNMDLSLNWNNFDSPRHSAEIKGSARIEGLKSMEFNIEPSEIFINDTLWTLTEGNEIFVDSGQVKVRALNFVSLKDAQQITVSGNISQDPADKLNINFKTFRLANFNPLLTRDKITLGGTVTGLVTLGNFGGNPSVRSNLTVSDFIFNDEPIGNGQVNATWDKEREAIVLDGRLFRDTLTIAKITGNYFLFREKEQLDVDVRLNKLRLYLLNPFFEGILSDINGIASGVVHASGNLAAPRLKGTLSLQRTSLTVDYLKTSYSFSGDLRIEPTWFGFDNITLFDNQGNKGFATGTVFHSNFKDFNLDLTVEGERLMALNTMEYDNPLYYGQAYFSGLVNISGYTNKLLIDVKGKTEKGTQLNFPLGGSQEVIENSFIRFVSGNADTSKTDPYKVDLNGIEMTMEVDMTNDAEIQLIFDPTVGDVMKGRGTGRLRLDITPTGDFTIFGKYTIDEGEYLFTLLNVINKRFRVERGGTIDFSGDIYRAQIDVNAVYKLRTSLTDLGMMGMQTGQRYPVETILHLSNDLMKPDINFDIQLPAADENTKSQFATIMANEQERNRQTFALLTLNHFVTPQVNGSDPVAAHGNVVGTSSSELLSNQLSNWLSQISNDFDIGVKYSPGDSLTNEELEVTLSTQIFNDRVSIDGNFGITNGQTTDANTLMDGTIEYKISKRGNLRVRAFNKSDPYRIADSNNPNRQGVGIFYRLEFDTLEDLWKNKIKAAFRRKEEPVPSPEPTQENIPAGEPGI